jgi:hypothetical protein
LLSETVVQLCQLGALSPTGRCKTFDADADGYGRGEGFAVVHMGMSDMKAGMGLPSWDLRSTKMGDQAALLHHTAHHNKL